MQHIKLNNKVINMIAANAFWGYVFENGMSNTINTIMQDDIPSDMWSMEWVQNNISTYLGPHINQFDSPIKLKYLEETVYQEVSECITRHVREEKNIIGAIFTEDFKDCKDPNFKFEHLLIETSKDSDENCGYKVMMQGDEFPNIGTLLLRTPLPSGVLLKKEDLDFPLVESFIKIKNTETALGFHKTLIFELHNMDEVLSNPYGYNYFLSGIFHLPTKHTISNAWYKLIPNTIGTTQKATLISQNGNLLSFSLVF